MDQLIKYCIILFVIGGGYKLYAHYYGPIGAPKPQGPNDLVVMYGLTTCGGCKDLARVFEEHGVRFTEYDIDVDRERNREFYGKVAQSDHKGAVDSVVLPSVEVNGVLLLNYPPFSEIADHFTGK